VKFKGEEKCELFAPCENEKEKNIFLNKVDFLLEKINRRKFFSVVGLNILYIESSPLSALAT